MRWLFILIFIPQVAFASVGEIGKIKGSGALERGKESIEAINGVGVKTMDTAVTAKGRMQIDFLDDTRVDITEHSRLLIDEFVYDPENEIGSLSIKATLGTVRYASGQIAKKYQQNVKIIRIVEDKNELISLYDKNNIMILPSYTEGYPMVILESLSRFRPCIVFKEIEHVVGNRKGIFVSNRNFKDLYEKINYIMSNYHSIQDIMKSNNLPDNESFIKQLKVILSNN